jgi:serine protease Do
MTSTEQKTRSVRSKALTSVAALAMVASGALGATVVQGQFPAFAQNAPITVETAQAPTSFADVVDKVKPAVVSVKVRAELASSRTESEDGSSRMENLPPSAARALPPLRRERHADTPPARRPRQLAGIGFFISATASW